MNETDSENDWIPGYVIPREGLLQQRADYVYGRFRHDAMIRLVWPAIAALVLAWSVLSLGFATLGHVALVVVAMVWIGLAVLVYHARQLAGTVVVRGTSLGRKLVLRLLVVGAIWLVLALLTL